MTIANRPPRMDLQGILVYGRRTATVAADIRTIRRTMDTAHPPIVVATTWDDCGHAIVVAVTPHEWLPHHDDTVASIILGRIYAIERIRARMRSGRCAGGSYATQ